MKNMKSKIWSVFGILLLSVFVDVSSSFAAEDDDYNFSWLDPDKKIYVLQNRRYRKANHAQIFLLGGAAVGETYRTAYQVQPRFGFWFNEELGLEAFYTGRFNSPNNAYKALSQAIDTNSVTKSPFIREIDSEFGLLLNWAPWYAKINVFNSILYFDWYFSGGIGTMQTEVGPKTKTELPASWTKDSLFAVYVGTGQLFHVSEHFKVRLDALAHFYSASAYNGTIGAPADKSIFSGLEFNLGIGYQL